MKNSTKLLKMTTLAMMVALGVVISPILRVEGMCPMAHFINIVCSVLLGPIYSLSCAVLIGIIRMSFMGIPPLALTGAIFGAFLSGLFYRLSRGNILAAVFGEIFGTGIIGALVSYPVMTLFWGKTDLTLLFYVPSFIMGTLIGGSIAYVFLKRLAQSGTLARLQSSLKSPVYEYKTSTFGDAAAICALGMLLFTAIKLAAAIFKLTSPVLSWFAYGILVLFIIFGTVYFATAHLKGGRKDA